MLPVDPLLVCNNFLYLSFAENIKITPMKLQKLLYFLYKSYLQRTNTPLFAERFQAWQYGPVLSSVYYEFKDYRDRCINHYYIDKNGDCYRLSATEDNEFSLALYETWNRYKSYSGIELSIMTHQPETAWRKAWVQEQPYLDDDDIYCER